jgi:hypothetical protein
MSLYYVGLGETQNRRSRLRRYDGLENRPWLPEHDLTVDMQQKIGEIKKVGARKEFAVSKAKKVTDIMWRYHSF